MNRNDLNRLRRMAGVPQDFSAEPKERLDEGVVQSSSLNNDAVAYPNLDPNRKALDKQYNQYVFKNEEEEDNAPPGMAGDYDEWQATLSDDDPRKDHPKDEEEEYQPPRKRECEECGDFSSELVKKHGKDLLYKCNTCGHEEDDRIVSYALAGDVRREEQEEPDDDWDERTEPELDRQTDYNAPSRYDGDDSYDEYEEVRIVTLDDVKKAGGEVRGKNIKGGPGTTTSHGGPETVVKPMKGFINLKNWRDEDPKDVMSQVYWLSDKIPPSGDEFDAAWEKLKAGLEKKYPEENEELADRDYDGDGELETSEDEWKGARDKAIKKAMRNEEMNEGKKAVEKWCVKKQSDGSFAVCSGDHTHDTFDDAAAAKKKATELNRNLMKTKKALGEAKKADKDYDGDGKVESPEDEWEGSRDKAIKKAMKDKKQRMKESMHYHTNDAYPISHADDETDPVNSVSDYDTVFDLNQQMNDDDARDYELTNDQTPVKVPPKILSALKDVIGELTDQSEKAKPRDYERSNYYADTAEAFQIVHDHIAQKTVEGLKRAQILAHRMMNVQRALMPDHVWKFIVDGGVKRSLKSYMNSVDSMYPVSGEPAPTVPVDQLNKNTNTEI